MKRIALSILPSLFLLAAVPTALPSSDVIDLGSMTVRTMKVQQITPSFAEDGSLRLTADLSEPVNPPCRVIWRIRGDAQGYALERDEGTPVTLFMGDPEARVTVEACLAEGDRSGGCRSITLTAVVLAQALSEAAWKEILLPDFTEPDFICQVLEDDQYRLVFYEVTSRVHTVTGEYLTEKEDLAVKVPGGKVSIRRSCQGGRWTWDHERQDLTLVRGPEGGMESIQKGATSYRPAPEKDGVFTDGIYRIQKTENGFRWESKNGLWKRYNHEGRLTAYGDRNGVIGRILFRAGQPVGLSDRNNQEVLWFEYDPAGLLRTVYDRNGRGVTYRYRDGRLSAVTDVLGNETRFSYDAHGRISEIVEPQGIRTAIAYDRLGRVTSVLDGRGLAHTFTWDYDRALSLYHAGIRDPSGKLTEIWSNRKGQARRVDINGRMVHRIAEKGNTLEVTDSRGRTTVKTFDHRRNLIKVVYPDGSSIQREYEPRFNRKVREIHENGVISRFSYDAEGNLVEKREASGTPNERVTRYTYDRDGNLLVVCRAGDDHTPEAVTRYTYDAQGNRIQEVDPEGNITTFQYDPQGRVLTRTDARGTVWGYAYDLAGRLTTVTDPLGHAARFFYDQAGHKVREVDANGKQTLLAYDPAGNLIRITDGEGQVTVFEYNAGNKLIRQIDPEGRITRYEYDLEGRVIKTTDGNGNEIVKVYDDTDGSGCPSCSGGGDEGRPSRILYPTFERAFTYDLRGRTIAEKEILSKTEAYETLLDYDNAGNRIAETDKEGKTTRYEYDPLNRLTRVMDPLNQETLYSYDNRDNLIRLTDAKGRATRFEYDRNNRLIKEIRPMGQETIYIYDGTGHLIRRLDAKGQTTRYAYDDAGRLVEVRYYVAADPATPIKTLTFAYDATGHLRAYDDGTTSAEYLYDDAYRKTSETVDYGPFSRTIRYTYYANGLKKTYTDPEGITYTYAYDANNQLTEVRIPGHGAITLTSYQWTMPEAVSLPGGATKNYVYDPLMRVKRITSKDPEKNGIMDYRYAYDRMDNITTRATEHGSYAYRYDDLHRMIDASSSVLDDESFTYDPVGNRSTASATTADWTYNRNNELQACNGVSFQYDANGNTILKAEGTDVTHYIYNEEDRLVRVEDGARNIIAEYDYDPFGRRLWKEVQGQRTCFLYSDEGLVAETDESGNVIRSYGWQPGSTWTTDPLFMKQGRQYYFYHNDHLGTPRKMTSESGSVVWSAKYEAFGKAKVEVETVENPLRFPGQVQDDETGLHHNWFRYYDPETGRYVKPDPVGLRAGINLYYYAKLNPLKNMDPNGLICGPGKFGDWFVPDNPGGYRFGDCCAEHDYCYNGNTGCKSKEQCEDEFYHCMAIKICESMDIPEAPDRKGYSEREYPGDVGKSKQQCKETAKIYYWFVKWFGIFSFCNSDRERNCGVDPMCMPTEKTVCEIGP